MHGTTCHTYKHVRGQLSDGRQRARATVTQVVLNSNTTSTTKTQCGRKASKQGTVVPVLLHNCWLVLKVVYVGPQVRASPCAHGGDHPCANGDAPIRARRRAVREQRWQMRCVHGDYRNARSPPPHPRSARMGVSTRARTGTSRLGINIYTHLFKIFIYFYSLRPSLFLSLCIFFSFIPLLAKSDNT